VIEDIDNEKIIVFLAVVIAIAVSIIMYIS